MNTRLINSHDRFFKELFSRKEEAREFIAKTFPKEISQKINFETLELDKTEYIDSKLRTHFSDVVYNCKYNNLTDIKITLLFEHKSYTEQYPHLQLLGYMLKIWELQVKQKQALTPIIPIIFYHGEQKWTKNSFDKYLTGIDGILQRFIPEFDYQIIDTSDFSDDEIHNLFKNLQLQIGILILKNIFNEENTLLKIDKIFSEINTILQTEQGEKFFEAIVSYLYFATHLETQIIVDKMRTVSPNAGDIFISTAQKLRFEGKIEGIETGMKKVAFSMLQKGYPDDEIIELTGLSKLQLDYLKTLSEFEFDLEIV